MDATFFKSAAEFRAWLAANHDQATELLVGFYKKGSGRQNMTYQEAITKCRLNVRRRIKDSTT